MSASKSEKMGKSVFFKAVISYPKNVKIIVQLNEALFYNGSLHISKAGNVQVEEYLQFLRWRAISLIPLPRLCTRDFPRLLHLLARVLFARD